MLQNSGFVGGVTSSASQDKRIMIQSDSFVGLRHFAEVGVGCVFKPTVRSGKRGQSSERTALFCTQAVPYCRLAIGISQGDLSAKGTMFRGKFVLTGHGSCNAFPGAGSTEILPLLVREEPLPPLPR
jgi:hypothetical protein